jgi:segregation and condensation protein B
MADAATEVMDQDGWNRNAAAGNAGEAGVAPTEATPEPGQELLLAADPVAEADLPALLEALLLVAPEPTPISELASAAEVDPALIESVIAGMARRTDRGWVVVRHRDTVHLASAPRFAPQVRRFLRLDREARLSGAALETVALIAYRQPVTRAEIEALRGVDCSAVLSTLHARGLIEVVGRLPTVGNPHQFGTTAEFLRQFGLQSLAELPPLEDLAHLAADHLIAEYPAAGGKSPSPRARGEGLG